MEIHSGRRKVRAKVSESQGAKASVPLFVPPAKSFSTLARCVPPSRNTSLTLSL